MAFTKLAEGVTTFAAASWADATGFAAAAELEVGVRFGPITGGLSQGGNNIEALDFLPSALGVVGGGTDGPLIVDASNSTDAILRNRGDVRLYIQAISGSGEKVENTDLGGAQRTFMMGGLFEDVTHDGGRLNANGSTQITNYYGIDNDEMPGSPESVLEYFATGLTFGAFYKGVHVIRRPFTAIEVGGDARVIIDVAAGSPAAIDQRGGLVEVLQGDVPTFTRKAGITDFSKARQGTSWGGTALNLSGGRSKGISTRAGFGGNSITVPAGWGHQPVS